MKAILVHEFGGPEVLKLEDVPTPCPVAGQVFVRIRAAAREPAISVSGPGLARSPRWEHVAISGLRVSGYILRKALREELTEYTFTGTFRYADNQVREDQAGSPIRMRIVEVRYEA
jgi:hypothetical protein